MKKFKFLFLLISLLVCCGQLSKAQTKVGIFIEKTTGLDDDEQAAYDWFVSDEYNPGHGLEKVVFTPDNISNLNANDVKVLWIPINRQGDKIDVVKPKAIYDHVETLKKYVKEGGNLYITNHATLLVSEIGRINDLYKPNTVTYGNPVNISIEDPWGVNPRFADMDYRGHVLYSDFNAGSKEFNYFLNSGPSREDHNCLWKDFNYTDFINATNSHILGKWSDNGDTNNFGVVEFMPTAEYKGTILCNGLAAYEWSCEGNKYVDNIKRFTENSISYLVTIDKKIGFLVPGNDLYNTRGADDDAKALEWFKTFYGAKAKLVTPDELASLNPAEVPVLWVPINHDGVSAYDNIDEVYRNSVDALKSYAQKGGNLYLTNYAALFVETMGRTNGNDLGGGLYANQYEIKNWYFEENERKDNGIRYMITPGFNKSGYFPYAGLADATGILKTSQFGLKEHHGIMWKLEGDIVNSNPEKFKKFEEGTHSIIWGLPDIIGDYARASVIEFQPYNEYLGTIFANGDFSYEWDETARDGDGNPQGGTGKNIYQYNIERYTSNILNYLLETAPATCTTTKAPINVDGKGITYWSTFYASNNRLLPEGVTAYAVKSNNDGRAQLVKVADGGQVIPGGQGYLLSTAKENGFYLTPSAGEAVAAPAENLLTGSDEARTFNKAGYKYYILGRSGEDFGFYWQKGTNGNSVNNAAHKAFLRVSTLSSAKFLSFTFGEETTGINGITASDAEQNGTALYNLAGQRVAKGYKGLVIKNGKKYLVK
ncbi:MAG: DUF4960 domain-containing protein [Prevotella sp.]|nr:DUF4960 domain-containing protein [Prevotella sp.]